MKNMKTMNTKYLGKINKHGIIIDDLVYTEGGIRAQYVCPECDQMKLAKPGQLIKSISSCTDCIDRNANLTGRAFGKLTAISRIPNGKWECRCECGVEVIRTTNRLLDGTSISCGCSARNRPHGYSTKEHRRLYMCWYHMIYRCTDPSDDAYSRYGGRGITVCQEWLGNPIGLTAFCDWALSHGYDNSLTIDRIGNDLGYYPSNCRWVSSSTQACNRKVTNLSGSSGVHQMKTGNYTSGIGISGKEIHLGTHQTRYDAIAVRNEYITDNNLPHNLSPNPILNSFKLEDFGLQPK